MDLKILECKTKGSQHETYYDHLFEIRAALLLSKTVFKKLKNDHETKTETQPVSNKAKNETKTSQTCLNTKTKCRDLTTLGLSP